MQFNHDLYIPPCCSSKYFCALLDILDRGDSTMVFPNADSGLPVILNELLTYVRECDLTICLPENAHPTILAQLKHWLTKTMAIPMNGVRPPWIKSLHIVIPNTLASEAIEETKKVLSAFPRTTLSTSPITTFILTIKSPTRHFAFQGTVSQLTLGTDTQQPSALLATAHPEMVKELETLVRINTNRSHILIPSAANF